jgi:hypothetical protein
LSYFALTEIFDAKNKKPGSRAGFPKKGGEDEHAFGLRLIFSEDLTNNIWHFYYNIGVRSLPNDNTTETIRSLMNPPATVGRCSLLMKALL